MQDEQLLTDFLSCRLPPEQFSHRNHTRATWLLLKRHPAGQAEALFCDALRRLAAHLGAAEKYHHTLTVAFVRLIAARIAAQPQGDWAAFSRCNPDLLDRGRELIARHYSNELLDQPAARQGFMAPDREALPCCESAS